MTITNIWTCDRCTTQRNDEKPSMTPPEEWMQFRFNPRSVGVHRLYDLCRTCADDIEELWGKGRPDTTSPSNTSSA